MITVEELQNTGIFKDFLPDNLARILPGLTEKIFTADETILYRGDPGDSMFIVLSGSVLITLVNDEGFEYTINTLWQGDNFGEIALMTGEPRSANVKAVTEVRLAELSQESFFELISEYPKLMDGFLRQLAQRRAKSMVREQFSNHERAEILAHLLSHKPPVLDHFLGKTKWTNDTNAAIEKLAASPAHILILGERGTGKDLAARLIHHYSAAQSRPLFHLDCANPPPIFRESASGKTGDTDEIHRELAQESALFGHGVDAGSYAKGVRKGYLELANGGVVVLENIDFLTEHVQRRLSDYLTEGSFVRTGENEPISSKIRFISTTSRTLTDLATEGVFDPELLACVNGELLLMKPLRERKKDIPVIAEHLVEKFNTKFNRSVSGFSKEAMNCLVDHDWPMNVDEMSQVLERAVVIAEDNTITERQVFLNLPTFSATGKFNLLKLPFLRKLVHFKFFPTGLRLVSVPFILGLAFCTLLGPAQDNPANLIVWAVWWPFLIFSIIVTARSWCGYCPLPIISDGVNFFRKKAFPVPPLLAKYGIWVGVIGFAMILLAEHVTHMFTAAHATSVLLFGIIASTAITNFFFGARSWCKHVCPLGRMVASSSAISLIELGSNSNVCTSQCQTHDCIKDGNCPMGIHPSAAATSKECIYCLSCLKRCRHQSVRIDLRFPWHEFNVRQKWDVASGFFAISLTGLVLAVKIPSWQPLDTLIEQAGGGTMILDSTLSLVIGSFFVFMVLCASGFLTKSSWKEHFSIAGSAYLFLAFAGFFNIYFHELVYTGHNLLPWVVALLGKAGAIPPEWITPNLGTLKAVIPLITLAGFSASFVMLSRLSRTNDLPPFVKQSHQLLLVITTVVFLVVL
jgi:transcriptional regulator with GAF, ATPase, and Fis domain